MLPHTRQSGKTMTSVSARHIILTPTQPVGSVRPQRGSDPEPPQHESRALPTELPRPLGSRADNARKTSFWLSRWRSDYCRWFLLTGQRSWQVLDDGSTPRQIFFYFVFRLSPCSMFLLILVSGVFPYSYYSKVMWCHGNFKVTLLSEDLQHKCLIKSHRLRGHAHPQSIKRKKKKTTPQ